MLLALPDRLFIRKKVCKALEKSSSARGNIYGGIPLDCYSTFDLLLNRLHTSLVDCSFLLLPSQVLLVRFDSVVQALQVLLH
jgi:hypothetical protein